MSRSVVTRSPKEKSKAEKSIDSPPFDPDPREAIAGCLAGNSASFWQLYERFRRPIFRQCYRRLGNYWDAEDASQETFAAALTDLRRWPSAHTFEFWLHRICRNVCADIWRKRFAHKRRPEGGKVVLELPPFLAESGDPETDAIVREVREAAGHLEHDLREVVELRLVFRMTFREMAATIGIHDRTARKRFARARQALSRILASRGSVERCSAVEPAQAAPADKKRKRAVVRALDQFQVVNLERLTLEVRKLTGEPVLPKDVHADLEAMQEHGLAFSDRHDGSEVWAPTAFAKGGASCSF